MEKFDIFFDNTPLCINEPALEFNKNKVALHHWQHNAVEFFFNNDNHALLNVATGAGKTTCAIAILKKIYIIEPDIKTLIVVPKNVIIDVWYKELYAAGFSLADIGVFYGEIKEPCKLTITNMQNISKIDLDKYQCRIFDEIHYGGAEKFYGFLKEECKYKLGLTATIDRIDKKHWKIIETFKYNIFRYNIKEALSDNIINNFKLITYGFILNQEIRDKYEEVDAKIKVLNRIHGSYSIIMKKGGEIRDSYLKLLNERKELVNNYYKKFDIVKDICIKHKLDKIIIFNQFNKQTNKLYWYLIENDIKSKIIHSEIDKKDRENILIDYRKDKFNILLCSKVLDEGYNLPSIDVGIIMAADSGDRQTIQRIGRVLRKKNKMAFIYILFCKDTIEELYSSTRINFFKSLASDYSEETIKDYEVVT